MTAELDWDDEDVEYAADEYRAGTPTFVIARDVARTIADVAALMRTLGITRGPVDTPEPLAPYDRRDRRVVGILDTVDGAHELLVCGHRGLPTTGTVNTRRFHRCLLCR